MNKEYFKSKYRIASARLAGYDYSADGAYFVTICTKCLKCCFGTVVNGKIQFSPLGKIAHKCWNEIPNHFPFVKLDEFVIMPNHVHGIIVINRSNQPLQNLFDDKYHDIDNNDYEHNTGRDAINRVSTGTNPTNLSDLQKHSPMRKNSLGKIIRWFKGRCSFKIHKNYPRENFYWQESFYDRIIENVNELERIREYIKDNPEQWAADRNNPSNLYIQN